MKTMSNEIKKNKRAKKERDPNKKPLSFETLIESIAGSGWTLIATVVATLIVVVAACLAVFFINVQGAEQVMVPNVTGKPLTTALYEMQEKELYPHITLRYSELPGEQGTVLKQDPTAGSIVKARRTIELTVSRGMQNPRLDNYVGKSIDTVKSALELEYSGDRPLLTVAAPIFQKSSQPAGTILAQYPEADYYVYDPIKMYFVVSSGSQEVTTKVPDIKGKSVEQVLRELGNYNVVIDFRGHTVTGNDMPDSITNVDKAAGTEVVRYSRINAEVALANRTETSEFVSGIYETTLAEYPYPVSMRLDARYIDGTVTTLANFAHPGNHLTIPYSVKPETTLVLYVMDQKMGELTVQ
jgi:beta-lactam-binding protein with PASTA domain